MIPRYTPSEFETLWSSATRYRTWLDVELAACEAMEHEKLVPEGTAARIRAKNIVLDPDRQRYYLMDTCGADLTSSVGSSDDELLDFVWQDWVSAMTNTADESA